MNEIAILGCGGHGRGLASIFRAQHVSMFYLDDEPLGHPVVGGSDKLMSEAFLKSREVVIGIGDNKLRQHFSLVTVSHGGKLRTARADSAVFGSPSEYGVGCQFFPYALIGTDCRIGNFVVVNNRASVDHDCVLGDASQIASGAVLGGGVKVGKRSLIGLGAVVLPKIKIGDDVIVGAGAVVTRDIPDGAVVKGNPAK